MTYTENLSVAKKQISDMAFLTHLTHARSSCYAVNEKKTFSVFMVQMAIVFVFIRCIHKMLMFICMSVRERVFCGVCVSLLVNMRSQL